MSEIKFRAYSLTPLPVGAPLIPGRTPSGWLAKYGHKITEEDFYNPDLSEADLKAKYTDDVLCKPTRITKEEFKIRVHSFVVMGIPLEDTVGEQLKVMDCELI